MGDNNDASSQVLACIASPSNFNNNYHRILQSISLNSKSYNDSFIKTISDVLNSSDYSPISKFYALYLLGKASETQNDFFAGRILKSKPLLDKLFTDCQTDGAKPMNDRGKKFFSKTPNVEESILGGNYIWLLLEIFSYWNTTYGKDNTEDPLHAYQIMFNTLAEKIKFPGTLLYLTRTYEITDDFHLMPPASLPRLDTSQRSVSPSKSSQPNSPDVKRPVLQSPTTTTSNNVNSSAQKPSTISAQVEQSSSQKKPLASPTTTSSKPNTAAFNEQTSAQKKPVTTTSSSSANTNNNNANPTTNAVSSSLIAAASVLKATGEIAGDDIRACLPSGRSYKNNSQRVFDNIKKNPKEYSASFVRVANEILKSKEEPPVNKFYLVYLLLKSTETRNQDFITEVASHHDLMNELFAQAQTDKQKQEREKGKKIFSKNPSPEEEKIGHNFLTVVLESFLYWKDNFVISGGKNPTHMFNKVISILATKTTLPQNFYYAGKVLDTDGDHLPTRFELIAPEDLQKTVHTSQKTENPKRAAVNEPQQQQTPGGSAAAGGSDASVAKLKEGLRKLQEDKTSLREFLENNQEESDLGQLLEILFVDVSNTYQNNVTPNVETVLTNPTPSSEKYITQVFTEGEVVEELNSAYSSYKKKKFSYKDLRSRALPLLKSSEESGARITPNVSETVNNFKTSQKEAIQSKTEEINRDVIQARDQARDQAREQVKSRATPILDSFENERASGADYQKQAKDILQGSTAYKQTEEFVERAPVVANEKRQALASPIEQVKARVVESPQVHTEIVQNAASEQVKKSSAPRRVEEQVEEIKDAGNQFFEKPRRVSSKKDIADEIYKFKASETIEDDNNNEPREVQSIQNLSPIKKVEQSETIEHDRSQRPFNSRVDEDNKSMKLSTMKSSSFKMTPSRQHTETEGEDWSKSMKLSRIKPQDLSMIESSIRQSFLNTGKKPPQFKPLSELQVKEEYEKEITKLKSEKDALNKEVNRLNSMLSEGPHSSDMTQSRIADDHLRQVLEQQQQRIEALQEENALLNQANNKLKKRSEVWENYKPANATEQESLQNIQEKLSLEERIKELESEISFLKTGKRQGASSSQNASSRGIVRNVSSNSNNVDPVRRSVNSEFPPRGSVTNPADASMQTPYDPDWANTNQTAPSYENSIYDVEWPASAYKEKMRATEGGDLRRQVDSNNSNIKKDEIAKTIKGRLVESASPVYSHFKAKVGGQSQTNDLRKFKVACLKAKSPLFESEYIQVGVSSNVVHDERNNLNMLKLVLYFENKGNQYIDLFTTDVIDGKGLNKIAKPNRLETGIERGKQVKQQIVLAFEKIPFDCLQLMMDVRIAGARTENFTLLLPTLITKFMQFKYVTVESFKEKWRGKSASIQKTEEIIIDTGIVKTAYDFKKYFNYLIDLKPMDEYDFVQGKKSIKLGGVFDLDIPEAEHLLKINVLPTHQVVFQIATTEKESYVASFILQALTFLFRK